MKNAFFILVICLGFLACDSDSDSSKNNMPIVSIGETNTVDLFLEDVNFILRDSSQNPIVNFRELSEVMASEIILLDTINVANALEKARKSSHSVVVVDNHTIMKITSFKDSKMSGSWGTFMPRGEGFIKKSELKYKNDYINNVIGVPSNKRVTLYLFNDKSAIYQAGAESYSIPESSIDSAAVKEQININLDSLEVINSDTQLGLARFIKADYISWDSLITDSDHGFCFMMDKNKNLFTGTAYKIEYGKDFWFLNEGEQNDEIRLKIIPFVQGLKKGVAKIINPLYDFDSYLGLGESLEDLAYLKNENSILMNTFNETPVSKVKKIIVFKFEDFDIEYFDVSAMVHFVSDEYYSMDGTRLLDVELWELIGFEDLSSRIALDQYKNKYLRISLDSCYAKEEQFGHYETDYGRFYLETPPYNCSPRTTITNLEVLKNFHPSKKQ